MEKFYIYIFLLLIMIILLFISFNLRVNCPKKIKAITTIVIICIALRYAVLLILFLVNNIKYLYLLKPLFFMNLIAVPIITLTVLYIFMRNDSINFSYIFTAMAAIILLYVITMFKNKCLIENYNNCGYIITFLQGKYIYWTYTIWNTIILFFTIILMNKNNVNKLGMILIMVSSMIAIAEYIILIVGITMPEIGLIDDSMWMIALLYALHKVKRKN